MSSDVIMYQSLEGDALTKAAEMLIGAYQAFQADRLHCCGSLHLQQSMQHALHDISVKSHTFVLYCSR